jgi:hypothetical protein
VLYHYVVEGHSRAQIPNREPVEIEAGEVLILRHNDGHLLGSHLDLSPVPAKQVVRVPPDGGLAVIRHGGGGEKARVVCGYLGCDRMDGNPLTSALPPIVRFDARKGSAAAWMKSSLEFAADEIAVRRAGSGTVLAKLSELLFVEALQRYVEELPEEQTGWLAALKDAFVSRALSLLHGRVANNGRSTTSFALSAFRARRSPIVSRGGLASHRCVTWRAGGFSWQHITCAAATCRLRALLSKWVTSRELSSTGRSSAASESRQPPGARRRPQQMWAARSTVEAFDRHSCTDTASAGLLPVIGHEVLASLVRRADKVIELTAVHESRRGISRQSRKCSV